MDWAQNWHSEITLLCRISNEVIGTNLTSICSQASIFTWSRDILFAEVITSIHPAFACGDSVTHLMSWKQLHNFDSYFGELVIPLLKKVTISMEIILPVTWKLWCKQKHHFQKITKNQLVSDLLSGFVEAGMYQNLSLLFWTTSLKHRVC